MEVSCQMDTSKFISSLKHSQLFLQAPVSSGTGEKRDPIRAIITGGIAGGIEAFISYPTEYVKTYMQLSETKNMTIKHAIKETYGNFGITGFYRGLPSLLWFSVPKVACRFAGFESLKNQLADENGKMTPFRTLLCGLGAGILEAVVAVTPMDTIKTRLIHDALGPRRFKGFYHGVRTIVSEHGLNGIYKGVSATVLKQGSNQAIRWLVFSESKERMAKRYSNGDVTKLNTFHTIIASILAGTASVYSNTPVDVLKTRMQGIEASKYKNTWDCFKQIVKNEGPTALYKGSVARLLRVCLDVTVVMVLYQHLNTALDYVWPQKKKEIKPE